MPRTKINKTNKKRSRGVNSEKLQEYDRMVEQFLLGTAEMHEKVLIEFEHQMTNLKEKTPLKVLSLKLMDVVAGVDQFGDCAKAPEQPVNDTDFTALSAFALRKQSTVDDGYSTYEETSRKTRSTSAERHVPKIIGPYMSAQIRKRRSRSAQSSSLTPQTNQLSGPRSNHIALKRLGSGLLGGNRPCRPKYRTPSLNGRVKAASVDRLMITPKVQSNTPLALMRHARNNEAVYSMGGSPVITSVLGDKTANVNIPVGNSILSIRPTEIHEVDPSYVSKIDKDTLMDLKVLQENINKILQTADLATTASDFQS